MSGEHFHPDEGKDVDITGAEVLFTIACLVVALAALVYGGVWLGRLLR